MLSFQISLSDHNLTSNVYSNNSQSSTSFSTELFGGDQLNIKEEIETDLIEEGFTEFISTVPNEQTTNNDNTINNNTQIPVGENTAVEQQTPNPQLPMLQQNLLDTSNNNLDVQRQFAGLTNNRNITNTTTALATIPNHQNQMAAGMPNNSDVTMGMAMNHADLPNNHVGAMQPPKNTTPITPTPATRKRNATRAQTMATTMAPLSQVALENLYLDEVKKRNVILVEQGEINRKRLRLEERKVKLMEEFFPKYLTLQQEILQKLDNVTSTAASEAMNVKLEN